MRNHILHTSDQQSDQMIINETNIGSHEQRTTRSGQYLKDDVHLIPLDDLYRRFHTDPHHGLSTASIIDAEAQYGANRIAPPRQPGFLSLLFKELFIGFNVILWLAGTLAFIAYKPLGEPNPSVANLALGVIVFSVIICNSLLNVYQEIKSMKVISSFSKASPAIVTVRRDSREQQILADRLLPGDIILIRTGDKLQADCRFIIFSGLKVNHMEVTGVSAPITCTIHGTSENLVESTNMGFHSSKVEEGTGEAVVVAIGDNTVLGKLSRKRNVNTGNDITGLHREVNRFVLFVCVATIIAIAILWATWAFWLTRTHHSFLTYNGNIINSIGMIVAFLPLGLPSTVTLVLTVVAKKMYQQRMLVKSLQIVETFNSISIIATDKTGTLTQNKTRVTHLLWDREGIYEVPISEPMSKLTMAQKLRRLSVDIITAARRLSISNNSQTDVLPTSMNNQEDDYFAIESSEMSIQPCRDLLLSAILCNNTKEQRLHEQHIQPDMPNIKSEVRLVGDRVDTALYELVASHSYLDIPAIRKKNPRLPELPFYAATSAMISANQLAPNADSALENDPTVLITMKGTPTVVIQHCSSYKNSTGEILPLNDDTRQHLINRQNEYDQRGYQVVALCQQKLTRQYYDRIFEQTVEFAVNDYCFIGFFLLFDPPRMEVPESILKARGAQIRVVLMTDDQSNIAKATAKQVHILTSAIADTNGTDTFTRMQDGNGQIIFSLYRNERLLEQHISDRETRIDVDSNEDIDSRKKDQANDSMTSTSQPLPWYKRLWTSCRYQFAEPKSTLSQTAKLTCIPYATVVEGTDIQYMDDFMWDWVLSHQELVFARISAEQKMHIVQQFQRRGEVVAITGHRRNDASVLKCANLGIAIHSGTDAAKESGDVILLDNSFSWIVQAIETGRLLGDNLKKVAIYLLPGGSWSQIWPLFFSLWFGMPLALSAIWCTIFCMLNDVFMSLAMAAEKPERNIMSRPPYDREKDHLLNLKLLIHAYLLVGNFECIAAFFCFCYYWIDNGVPFYSFMFTYENFGINPRTPYTTDQLVLMNNVAQSIYYCSMCLFQFFNYFATRTRYTSLFQHNPIYGKGQNLYVFLAMFVSAGIQLIFTQISWFNKTLGTGPVPIKYIVPTFAFGTLWLIIDEIRKFCMRKWPRSMIARLSW